MAEEKPQSRSEEKILDQEALDQMLGVSAGEDVKQLESMLNELEDSAETQDDEVVSSEETDMDELSDNMEALLNRMESGDTASEKTDAADTKDRLFQATRADTEQPQAEAGGEGEEKEGTDSVENEEEIDLNALLSDTERDEESELIVSNEDTKKEGQEEASDLKALLEEAEETSEEASDLDALLEEAEEASEEASDLNALLEEAEEASEEASDLNALLEEAEEASEEASDLNALLEEAEETSEEESDLNVLLADAENKTEEVSDLDALLEEAEETSEEESDLDALLADAENKTEEVSDLDALLEEAEETSEEESDLDALLADAENKTEEASDLDALLEEAEETSEEESDLNALLDGAEEVSEEDVDLDDLLDDLLEDDEEIDLDDLEEIDLDDLLENSDSGELKIGVEDEVAQILTTGGSSTGILKDFQSVQANLFSGSETDGESGVLLMIDGDAENRTLFQDALSSGDYQFLEASDGRQALQVLRREDVDLVLINLDENPEEALELVQTIVSNPELPNLPIIVNSEHNDQIERALRLGAVDYLTRPLDVMDIEFQIPHKVANQIKLRKAERILAGSEGTGLAMEPDIDEGEDDLDTLLEEETGDFASFLDREIDAESDPESLLVAAPGGTKRKKSKDRVIALSDQEKMLRERKQVRRRASRLPLVMSIAALLVGLGAVSYYAIDFFKDYLQSSQQASGDVAMPVPVPRIKPPEVPQQDYAMSQSAMPAPTDNMYRQQAEVLKGRIRQNVRTLSESGGAWWSPWRVMRESGASVDGLVNRRSVDDILDAFGVDRNAVENGLQNERSLDFLASVGFDLRGKRASDLTARETFELLSARQIRSADQLVEILSKLTDKLADDRTAQAEHKEREQRKRKGQPMGQTTWRLDVHKLQDVVHITINVDSEVEPMFSIPVIAQNDLRNKPPPSEMTSC